MTGEPLSELLMGLRRESARGPGHGLYRLARLLRGGAGLARKVVRTAKAGSDGSLNPHDLREIESIVRQLGDLKGVPMKFGQILSYLDLDLPEQARDLLSLLQTQSPATPRDQMEKVTREDLGDEKAKALWQGLNPEPVSIASIGQVYRGRLPDGSEVAVKVRHPGVDRSMQFDLDLASVGTGIAGTVVPGMGTAARDFLDEIRARLLEECDYALEAERQRLFGRLYLNHPAIVVPSVHDDWCGPRVLTSSWETGQGLEVFRLQARQEERDRAGAILFDFYIGTLYRHGLFHADPHPGNYSFRDGGQVVVFDYGCVRIFEPQVATSLGSLAQAVRDEDREAIYGALSGMGAQPPRDDEAYAQLLRLLRGFFGPVLVPGIHRVDGRFVTQMGQLLKDKLAVARLRLPGSLMFLFRIRFGLFAVLSRLGAACDWATLERELPRLPPRAGMTRLPR